MVARRNGLTFFLFLSTNRSPLSRSQNDRKLPLAVIWGHKTINQMDSYGSQFFTPPPKISWVRNDYFQEEEWAGEEDVHHHEPECGDHEETEDEINGERLTNEDLEEKIFPSNEVHDNEGPPSTFSLCCV